MLGTKNDIIPGISHQFDQLRGEMMYDQLRTELVQQLDPMRAEIAQMHHQLNPMRMELARFRDMSQTP